MTPTVSIIGSGNVAWHLANRLSLAGYEIINVCGRNPEEEAEPFESITEGLVYVPNIELLDDGSDIYILCVNDDAIQEVLDTLPFKLNDNQILVHTSGSVPSSVLAEYAKNYGVLWPVMTLTKYKEPQYIDSIPYVITSHNEYVSYHLVTMADQISSHFTMMVDEKRIQLHLAAVIANNFSNHIFTLTAEYCEKMELDFDLLKDIIGETAYKIETEEPANLQTGPAKRNDKRTIEKHLQMLEDQPDLYKIYCIFTESIIQKYHPK
ncbi:MAG: DUF2520 domain-containing protein [Saprospiraceae bacterium]|nr:DUF2520 domain-containing protein [Saprospiraceae bacterium]